MKKPRQKKYTIVFNGKDIAQEGNAEQAKTLAQLKFQVSDAKKKTAEVIKTKTRERVFAQYTHEEVI